MKDAVLRPPQLFSRPHCPLPPCRRRFAIVLTLPCLHLFSPIVIVITYHTFSPSNRHSNMHSPIASSTSYSAVTVVATGRMNEEDRIDLMRFLFMGPTSSLGDRGRENLGAVGDWFDDDSEVSVPELVADLDDSFLGLDTEEQGKEATAVEETVTDSAHGGDPIDQEQVIRLSEEVDSEEFEEEGECVVRPAHGAPSLSIKSLTLYRQLGEGGFGQVYTASLEGSSKVHAVKIIPKVGENKDQTFREQDLLRRLIGCPFFSQLEASWQSSLNYYIVTVFSFSLRHPTDVLLILHY